MMFDIDNFTVMTTSTLDIPYRGKNDGTPKLDVSENAHNRNLTRFLPQSTVTWRTKETMGCHSQLHLVTQIKGTSNSRRRREKSHQDESSVADYVLNETRVPKIGVPPTGGDRKSVV